MSTPEDQHAAALSTKVEEEFISPLTAIRGALEILRDYPDLSAADRAGFIRNALGECDRLQSGIDHLAATVYAAGRDEPTQVDARYADRIHMLPDLDVVDLDFSNFQFQSSEIVNAFYDAIDSVVIPTQRNWIFLVNDHNCQIWPEAWVAYAHRSKKISLNFALTTIRYAEGEGEAVQSDPKSLESRDLALAAARDFANGLGGGAD